MVDNEIPDIIVSRLPMYLRTLQRMDQDGKNITSSQEMGDRLGISAAQIRKDLSQFGEFGKQGTGYDIQFLIDQLSSILNLEEEWEMAVIGAGDMGSAVARYKGFSNRGFKVTMLFDSDPSKVGSQVSNFIVKNTRNMIDDIRISGIKIAMLAVPAPQAQEVAEKLVEAGVKAILNYAPINISVPEDVYVEYIDPSIHLQKMTYYIK